MGGMTEVEKWMVDENGERLPSGPDQEEVMLQN